MSGFENFIGFNPWTALFTLLNMVITFLILKKFLFKPVNKMIDDRQKEIDGLFARVTQHEVDHLDGKVFTDRLSSLRRTMLKRRLNDIATGKVHTRYKMKRK